MEITGCKEVLFYHIWYKFVFNVLIWREDCARFITDMIQVETTGDPLGWLWYQNSFLMER